MTDSPDTLFELEPPGPAPAQAYRGGNRKGIRNKRSNVLWRQAELASPEILRQRIAEAQRLSEYVSAGELEKAQISLKCGDSLLARTMPRPRSAPILNLDVSQQVDARTLLAAMAHGDLTPADASSLLSAMNKNLLNGHAPTPNGNSGDAKKKLEDKLKRAIEARRASNGHVPEEAEEITLETLDAVVVDTPEEEEEIVRRAMDRYGS